MIASFNQEIPFEIKDFMSKLSLELNDIPKIERDQHLLEIQSHLIAIMNEKINEGIKKNQAIKETINEFVNIKDLAEQIKNTYKEKEKETYGQDILFKFFLGLPYIGLGQLALSIYNGEIFPPTSISGLTFIIIPTITLFFWNFNVSGKRLDFLKTNGLYLITIGMPVGAFAFIYKSIQIESLNFTSLITFAIYILIVLVLYLLNKTLFNHKKNSYF